MKKIITILVFIVITTNAVFSQWNVENVPDPKNSNTGYVNDPDNFLRASTIDSMNRMLQFADTGGYMQCALVVLKSIGDEVPKEFATKLFNFWGLGHKQKNDGLLILLVMDQHRVEFETGYGLETVLTDADCYNIQQVNMVPYFKQNNYDEGLLEGLNATIYKISKSPNFEVQQKTENHTSNDNKSKVHKSFHQTAFFKFYGSLIIFFVFIFIICFIISLFQKDYYVRYKIIRIFTHLGFVVLLPFPFLLSLFFLKKLLEQWRNTPRISQSGKIMHKLNEKDDDNFLSRGQVKEEQIKSIDYDVWVTDDEQEILVLAYKRWGSKYSQCPKCKFRTFYLKFDQIIVYPTNTTSGTGEKRYECENCNHSKTVTYTIPAKGTNSSSSSSFGGGSSFDGGGGGSWGGGSSGGGGSGSSW